MKRNNVAKRFGIATLCLATAISAFSGITSVATDVALAEVAATDMITATDATVTREEFTYTSSTSTTNTATGLRISSDTAYEATFNTVFNGNSVFRFRVPETYDSNLGMYGDFKFHIADATDPENCFDIIYYAYNTAQTRVYVQWKGEIRTSLAGIVAGKTFTNDLSEITTTYYAPCFLSQGYSTYGAHMGIMALVWNNGILSVQQRSIGSSTAAKKAARMKPFAYFDGTYDATATDNGFTGRTAFGLPKMSFPNGYTVTISSNFTKDGVDDHGSDVVFYDVRTNATATYITQTQTNSYADCSFSGGQLYSFNDTEVTDFTSNYTKAYDEIAANEGKALLGWTDAEGALYPTTTALTSADISAYNPVFLGFDTMKGASVRIDPTGGQSGLRFMMLFDKAEYAAAEGYIQSQGTLIAYTTALNLKNFTYANYETEITAETTIAQVPNTKSKMFNYNVATNRVDDENGQPAYSMALVGISDYTQEYSARGYLVVQYADETTQYIYTAYNEENNVRSIAEVAYKVQQLPDYQNYTAEQKAVVDGYAALYVAPESSVEE